MMLKQFFLLSISLPVFGSTGVGHGGDVVDQFLRTTRIALQKSLQDIRAGIESESICHCTHSRSKHPVCESLNEMTSDQRNFCTKFIKETASQMVVLSGVNSVPFKLTNKKLEVLDPYGKPRPVAAITSLGPYGDITFHYDSIRFLSPIYMMVLMGHEFGHKVIFQGDYVEDNVPIGPFGKAGGGRVLLDKIGAALARYAVQRGYIGAAFGIEDHYSCRIFDVETGLGFGSQGVAERMFRLNDWNWYETSVGFVPKGFSCYLMEAFGKSMIQFQVKIIENNGCLGDQEDERTTIAELRRFRKQYGEFNSADSVLLKKNVQKGFNPICFSPGVEKVNMEYAISGRNYVFEIRYLGSVGKTFSHVKW